VIATGDLIEEYADAKPFPKCLIMAHVPSEPLYVACAFGSRYAYITTVHRYDPDVWLDPWTRRKQFENDSALRPLRRNIGAQNHHPSAALGTDLYEFENVPALVCRQCGEVYLPAEVTQRIDSIIQEHPEPQRYHQVPVFSLGT
jgi:hypothetical protein